jgi:hypothetical protein
MNIQQAKQIGLSDLLSRLGHTPQFEKHNEKWYLSPFRQETEPSFKLSATDKAFFDFGLGSGGNILDFIKQYRQLATVEQALEVLDDLMGGYAAASVRTVQPRLPLFDDVPTPVAHPPVNIPVRPAVRTEAKQEQPAGIQIQKVRPLQNRALMQYLEGRGIPVVLARHFVEEAYYTVQGRERTYFGLAWQNEVGGYELKNAYFTGVSGKKGVSLVKRKSSDDPSHTLRVFEGMMDCLSWLVWEKRAFPDCPVLILNSVAMKDQATTLIRTLTVEDVLLYLDHDEAGRTLTSVFQQTLADLHVSDESGLYAEHKDFNAFLQQHVQARRMERA